MVKHILDDTSEVRRKKQRSQKSSRKDALRLEDITPSPTPEGCRTPASNVALQQPPGSNALGEVAQFLNKEKVQISDSINSNCRPVLRFSDLPAELVAQFGSIFKSFERPSPIQSAAWPFLLAGRDVVGVAETGSGKTLAFGLPLMARLAVLKKRKGLRAVIIAPTRELTIQVFEQIQRLCELSSAGYQAACIYGGTNKDAQRGALNEATVVVATPGRLKDFLSDGSIDVSKTKYLVLDEADRMLDKGFEDDIKHIVSQMPPATKRQTAMFTATWPKPIRELASTFMTHPVKTTIGHVDSGDSLRANARIRQVVEVIDPASKQQRLLQLLKEHHSRDKSRDRILLFCLYKKEATRIEQFLRGQGLDVGGIHGDMSQRDRITSLEAFKKGEVSLLVATDVAARGLDIPNVKVVINITFPLTAEDYVHRIGRTGRAGSHGLAITLFTEHDKGLAGALVNVLKEAQQPVPEDLLKFGTTVKKKQHEVYGAFFRDTEGAKVATKITFDD